MNFLLRYQSDFCLHSQFTPLSPCQGTGSADGDSATEDTQRRLREFRAKLDELTEGRRDFTFVMDVPSGNSYLQVGRSVANSDLVRKLGFTGISLWLYFLLHFMSLHVASPLTHIKLSQGQSYLELRSNAGTVLNFNTARSSN